MKLPQECPTTQPHDASARDGAICTLPVRFTGSGREYFRIWIVNLLLTVITLSLYWPFARARRLAYFQGHTLVGREPLAFHGDPWKMFRGYLLMLVLGLLAWAVGRFAPSLAWLPLLALTLLWPALWQASLRFRLRNTSWRGVRLAFVGSTAGAYRALLPLFVPVLVLVGLVPAVDQTGEVPLAAARQFGLLAAAVLLLTVLLGPWMLARLKRYQHGGYAMARERTRLQLDTPAFYALGMRSLGMAVLVGALVAGLGALAIWLLPLPQALVLTGLLFYVLVPLLWWPWFTARLQNLLWNRTGSRRVRFSSDLSFERLAAVTALNWWLIALTLGLYWPWAQVRLVCLRLQAMSVDIDGDANAWLARTQAARGGVVGDAAGDFFGLDLGL